MVLEKKADFANIIFTDEKLNFANRQQTSDLPLKLKEARQMEGLDLWEDRRAVFLKQGRFLADYEDDYDFDIDPVRYFPTYQSLTDKELRAYFSWRTQVRKGFFLNASLSFIFLYTYELINNIGVKAPMDGYAILSDLKYKYGLQYPRLDYYLERWLIDYVVYYDLDVNLLKDSSQALKDQCVSVLENIESESQDKVLDAVKQLAPKWLKRSKFYAENFEDMDAVIFRVLKKMTAHYAKGYKHSFVDQYFGLITSDHVQIFPAAVFANPLKRVNYRYKVDSQWLYKCQNGLWTVNRRAVSWRGIRKLENLLKTIDSVMREASDYKHPIKNEISTKWIAKLIQDEVTGYFAEKTTSAKNKLSIDFLKLDKIRLDAEETKVKLIVEEEEDTPPLLNSISQSIPDNNNPPLSQAERRLLYALLYNEDLSWIKSEGHILSVLTDSINEKLYDIFADSVIDESNKVLDDYADDLKEILTQ